ncbi:hypothetical protein NDN08_005340 [Rhodosorus marinus]|uniref:Calcium-binding protein n=1 Tax=Rhodosorus marinus TaxID=101924 RepID=A0AAV8V296_9RHOD|nr:hypothetical protein NDN08_005340 [Rhodosorus marinus]
MRGKVVFLLLLVVIGIGVAQDTCASFELPEPTTVRPNGEPTTSNKRAIWGDKYCRKLTLRELDGMVPVVCVNTKMIDEDTTCLKMRLRNVDLSLVKSLKIGVHPNCNMVPPAGGNPRRFQSQRLGKNLAEGQVIKSVKLCFDRIPATQSCCGTSRCLVMEATIDVNGVDTTVEIDDRRCGEEPACRYYIGCPNVIDQESDTRRGVKYFYGTDSDDLILLPDYRITSSFTYDGRDVILGGNGNDRVFVGGGENIMNGGLGNDQFDAYKDGVNRVYLGDGFDGVRPYLDGGATPDYYYGGPGYDVYFSYNPDDNDVVQSFDGLGYT